MLWLSEPVLNGPHAVHRALPEDLVAALGTFLDEMPTKAPGLLDIIEPLHSGGYVPAVPENYRTLRGVIDTAARR
jgi:phosphonate transport system substrate-binding protein